MQRRRFLRLSLLAPLSLAAGLRPSPARATGGPVEPTPDGRPRRFTLGHQAFLLDGVPLQIRSGEMHPIRIPAAYWRHRIRMARAMGLNTIALYLMWNALEPEPGKFDFSSDGHDFVRFIRLCQQEGMWVYLRPGPYVCAEWDFGGLPPWLLRTPGVRVRDRHDVHYMDAVARYLDAIAPRIAPLMADRGGPILMLQVENEYASFGRDRDYLATLRRMWIERGIDGPFSLSDGLGQIRQADTYLPGTALGLDGDSDFATAQAIAGEAPVWVGEGYPGWLTHWGEDRFQGDDYLPELRELLAANRSFNLYVVHGGTNFGFGAGANAKSDGSAFQPVITSYDYGAPIDEQGAPMPAWHAFRQVIARSTGHTPPSVPTAPPHATFAAFVPVPAASLWDALPEPLAVAEPRPNELLTGQTHGLVLYRRQVVLPHGGRLDLAGVRDDASVYLDGRRVGRVCRIRHPSLPPDPCVDLPPTPGATLEILVDSFGHVGYGAFMTDRKGLVDTPTLDGRPLKDWQVFPLPLDQAHLRRVDAAQPGGHRHGRFFHGTLRMSQPGDCYLDMAGWDQGYLWVNGHLLGRYWRLGPQQRLYCPGCWLQAGDNAVRVLDLHRSGAAPIGYAAILHG